MNFALGTMILSGLFIALCVVGLAWAVATVFLYFTENKRVIEQAKRDYYMPMVKMTRTELENIYPPKEYTDKETDK